MWDVDSLDWKSKNEAAILIEIQHQVRNGSIILMHDIHGPSVNSLPSVIEYLKGEGYTFVTVPELSLIHISTVRREFGSRFCLEKSRKSSLFS